MEEGRVLWDWLIPDGKTWVDVFQALLTPVIALSALALGVLQYRLALRQRADELFDRRWKLYCDFKAFWLSTGEGAAPGELGDAPMEIIDQYAEEVEILFGRKAGALVSRLPKEGHTGGAGRFLEPEIAEAFISRMRLEA